MSTDNTHPPHDFIDLLLQEEKTLVDKHTNLLKNNRARNNPTTVGDSAEEQWKAFFETFLPNYQIVTHGTITNENGTDGNQFDVLILHPNYPRKLSSKFYFSSGVLALFECKLTLNKSHIFETIRKVAETKRLFKSQEGTFNSEVNPLPIFGLLAHSHSWKCNNDQLDDLLFSHFITADKKYINHPREMLDLICVADYQTWIKSCGYSIVQNMNLPPSIRFPEDLDILTVYSILKSQGLSQKDIPIGNAMIHVLQLLSQVDPGLLNLENYYREVLKPTEIKGVGRNWSGNNVLSQKLSRQLQGYAPDPPDLPNYPLFPWG